MVDSWCHTWSQWGTNPRIGWCAWSWWLPLLRSHPLAPRLLGPGWCWQNFGIKHELTPWGKNTVGVFRKWRVWPATNQELNVKNWTYPNYSRGWPGIWNDLPQFLAIWMRKMILESTQYPMVSPILDQPAMVRPSFHDTSCSRPCICRDEDHISPSSRLVRKRTWWSLPPTTVHDRPSPPKWPAHKRSTWNECEGTGPNWSGILDVSQSQGRTKNIQVQSIIEGTKIWYVCISELLKGKNKIIYMICASQKLGDVDIQCTIETWSFDVCVRKAEFLNSSVPRKTLL